jgi:DNA repair protein RadC
MTSISSINTRKSVTFSDFLPSGTQAPSMTLWLFDHASETATLTDAPECQPSATYREIRKSSCISSFDKSEDRNRSEAQRVTCDGGLSGGDYWKELCARLLTVSSESVSDTDLLALLLSYLGSDIDSREMAETLISRFETFGNVMTAGNCQLSDAAQMGPTVSAFFDLVRAASTRLAREEICSRPILETWDKLIAYLRTTMAHQRVEQVRILFLDRRNVLIADEVQHTGTIDHTPLYPREVAKRALALDASAIIMAHNHPSNHPSPSRADIEITQTINDTLNGLGIVLHDHIIISRRGHTSFRMMGLLRSKAA